MITDYILAVKDNSKAILGKYSQDKIQVDFV